MMPIIISNHPIASLCFLGAVLAIYFGLSKIASHLSRK